LFPLGTEMTATEQALAGALTFLKSAGYADLMRTLVAGVGASSLQREQDALERLSLASGGSLLDRALRTLVLGALRRG
jgi:hypothetical protein